MKHLHLVSADEVIGKNGVYDMDCSKIIISTKGTSIDGEMLRPTITLMKWHTAGELILFQGKQTYGLHLTSGTEESKSNT